MRASSPITTPSTVSPDLVIPTLTPGLTIRNQAKTPPAKVMAATNEYATADLNFLGVEANSPL